MKPLHTTAVILIALVAGFVGAQMATHGHTTTVAKESAYDRIVRTGELRCGYALWPPTILAKDPNTNTMSGVSKDVIETMAKNLNLKVSWVEETGWGSWPEGLTTGRFDVFCGMSYQSANKGRSVRYTQPIFFNPVYGYARSDDTRFDADVFAANKSDIRVSGQDGEISETVAHNFFPQAHYIGQPQMTDLSLIFLNVATGKADIVFNEPGTADDFISKNPGKLKRVTQKPLQVFSVGYALAMNEPNLQAMLDSAIVEMQNDGTITRILAAHNAKPEFFLPVKQSYQVGETGR